jgi:hypothetical protein
MVQSDVMIIINMDVLWAGVTNYNEHFHALALCVCVSVKCALVNVYVHRSDICVCSLSAEPHAASQRAHKGKKGTKRDVGCQNGIMLNNNVKLNNHNNTICACIHLRARILGARTSRGGGHREQRAH